MGWHLLGVGKTINKCVCSLCVEDSTLSAEMPGHDSHWPFAKNNIPFCLCPSCLLTEAILRRCNAKQQCKNRVSKANGFSNHAACTKGVYYCCALPFKYNPVFVNKYVHVFVCFACTINLLICWCYKFLGQETVHNHKVFLVFVCHNLFRHVLSLQTHPTTAAATLHILFWLWPCAVSRVEQAPLPGLYKSSYYYCYFYELYFYERHVCFQCAIVIVTTSTVQAEFSRPTSKWKIRVI